MNIYAEPGTKIVFRHPNYGYGHDQRNLKNLGLVVGQTYTVAWTEVGDSHTHLYLEEFPGVAFNSVNFEDVD
jgi:hypothetical protein